MFLRYDDMRRVWFFHHNPVGDAPALGGFTFLGDLLTVAHHREITLNVSREATDEIQRRLAKGERL